MTSIELIQAAYDRLLDEHDEDPRSALMRGLHGLLSSPRDVPDDAIHLAASIQPGGVFTVTDQHGRRVQGVTCVTAFRDQGGRDIMQINL